jgi:hypothetical protein
MFRIEWPNGDVSVNSKRPWAKNGVYGFYNKSRASELSKRENIENYTLHKNYNSPMARLDGP